MNRGPQAIGFYPGDKSILQRTLSEIFSNTPSERKYKGGIVPHAGYVYSGLAAASLFSSLEKFNSIVILGVDHYGSSTDISLHPYDTWETPLGKVPVENELAEKLDFVGLGMTTSEKEHSIEVQLPFLQYLNDNFTFLPITIPKVPLQRMKEVGDALKTLDVPIIATTDMSHYVSREEAFTKDSKVLETIMKMNPEVFLEKVRSEQVTMCGSAPVATLLFALNSFTPELLMYYTSGDVTHDNDSVVGYASMGFR